MQQRLLKIDQLSAQLRNALQKAAGSGAWYCPNSSGTGDIVCRSYVNTVLNNRYSGTRIRYENALRVARATAYYARRAIEQRFGVRLDALDLPIGPLEAPSKWADRVCTMHGVDFDALAEEKVQTDAALKKAWLDLRGREYANSFVGDYVDLLTSFTEFYNVEYPTQDGNDTLMLSMREDAMRQNGNCSVQSRNRLRSSDMMGSADWSETPVDGVWQAHKCGASEPLCLEVSTWSRNVTTPVAGDVLRGAWLRTRANYNDVRRPEQGIPGPSGMVSQGVVLPAGDYVLSFRSLALDSAGVPVGTAAPALRASVFDESGATVTTTLAVPGIGNNPNTITNPYFGLQTLKFSVATTAQYRIAFAPSGGSGLAGNILLASPQLERVTPESPIAYQSTDREGLTESPSCPSTPSQLLARFTRKCSGAGLAARCFYESVDTISIDTQAQAINGSSLAEKLAAENFNYRHVDLALNLVGTGVRNCDENPTPACYGSGTIEYDLVHEANQVGIEGYDKEARRFDFGEAAVRHGKAITAERYLTLPLSSADTGLLAQTGIVKTELRGRPLDGRYKIRIYESPALRWNRLEDIQLMVRYRYWSRITGNAP